MSSALAPWCLLVLLGAPEQPERAPPPRVAPDSLGDAPSSNPSSDLPRLERTGQGGYRYREAGFTAHIRPDGSVEFKDVPPRSLEPRLTVLGFDLLGRPRPRPQPIPDWAMPWGRYGSPPPPILFTVGGRFGGIADATLPARHYAAKQAFLDRTAEFRANLASQFRAAAAKEAAVHITQDLLRMWRDERTPLSIRRERLFAWWDEFDEPSPGQDPRHHAGAVARAKIEAFIRRHAARGSAKGFSDNELAEMNGRRRSVERFDPYHVRTEPARVPGGSPVEVPPKTL